MKRVFATVIMIALVSILSLHVAFAEGNSQESVQPPFQEAVVVTPNQETIITPQYVPCPIWEGPHRFVATGYQYSRTELYQTHQHAIYDTEGNLVYATCDIYGTKTYKQYICACGTEEYRTSWSNFVHHIQ